ncbi:MAG: hypothetical protein ABI831_04365 [Betaproteobacteria bacterium]
MERVAFLIEQSGARVDCLLNPETVIFRRQAGLKRRSVLGQVIGDSAWSDDMLICGGGGLTEVQLDLLFDTSLLAPPGATDDVQSLTAPFWDLAEHTVNSQGFYEPNLARFVWGKTWNVLGVVSAVAERFEHFLPSGAPQRSWLRLNFVRVADAAAPRRRPAAGVSGLVDAGSVAPLIGTPGEPGAGPGADAEELLDVGSGAQGRLDQLAYELTGDPANWRKLAQVSGIDDPSMLSADSLLRIPPDIGGSQHE